LSAFSFAVAGGRQSLGPWVNGPGYRPAAAETDDNMANTGDCSDLIPQESRRSAIKRRCRLYYNNLASHIPHAVVHGKLYEIHENGELLESAPLITDAVDFLGNPIDAGGRPYSKRKPLRTKANGNVGVTLLGSLPICTATKFKKISGVKFSGYSRTGTNLNTRIAQVKQ
jgi:hypothetical protein